VSFPSLARIRMLMCLVSMLCLGLVSSAAPYESAPQQSPSPSRAKAACAVEMLTASEGVDFNSYLRDVYVSVKKRWFANMAPSVEKGQQGTNTIEFHVLQDGSVPKDSVKMIVSSEKNDLDAASMQGIQEAIPFNHLPEKFSRPFIVLRFFQFPKIRTEVLLPTNQG
jgi:TonB family protein